MNETTDNFFEIYDHWEPSNPPMVIFRLIYDEKTGKAIDLVVNETDKMHIVITREQADLYPHLDPRAYVVNGKLQWKIKKLNINEQPNQLLVKEDSAGQTITDYNMLIINNNGNQRWTYE